jgi:hypothetical protein
MSRCRLETLIITFHKIVTVQCRVPSGPSVVAVRGVNGYSYYAYKNHILTGLHKSTPNLLQAALTYVINSDATATLYIDIMEY